MIPQIYYIDKFILSEKRPMHIALRRKKRKQHDRSVICDKKTAPFRSGYILYYNAANIAFIKRNVGTRQTSDIIIAATDKPLP